MHLLSVNLGTPQPMNRGGKVEIITGIYKHTTPNPVQINALGLEGDNVMNKKHHGGPDQAVYVYGDIDYAWWGTQLGHDLEPGMFGDNLTISGLESAPLHIGDRLHVGEVILEITSPRIPCVTLATRMGDPTFVKRFRAAERPGLYCRVIQTGCVQAGDAVRLEPYTGDVLITAGEMFRLYYENPISEGELRRLLAAPIAIRARTENEEKLAEILAG